MLVVRKGVSVTMYHFKRVTTSIVIDGVYSAAMATGGSASVSASAAGAAGATVECLDGTAGISSVAEAFTLTADGCLLTVEGCWETTDGCFEATDFLLATDCRETADSTGRISLASCDSVGLGRRGSMIASFRRERRDDTLDSCERTERREALELIEREFSIESLGLGVVVET